MRKLGWGLVWLPFAAGVPSACDPPARMPAAAPVFDPGPQQTKCSIAKSQSRPLIVEWPSADRADLEAQRLKGSSTMFTGEVMPNAPSNAESGALVSLAGLVSYQPNHRCRQQGASAHPLAATTGP